MSDKINTYLEGIFSKSKSKINFYDGELTKDKIKKYITIATKIKKDVERIIKQSDKGYFKLKKYHRPSTGFMEAITNYILVTISYYEINKNKIDNTNKFEEARFIQEEFEVRIRTMLKNKYHFVIDKFDKKNTKRWEGGQLYFMQGGKVIYSIIFYNDHRFKQNFIDMKIYGLNKSKTKNITL